MSFLLALSDDCAMYSRHSSSVMASICSRFSSFSADFIFTTGSTNVRFFDSSSIPFIILAARGAHVPFSTKAIVRFLNALSVRWSIYSFMNGNMPELYVVVAKTSLLYLKASATASDISHLARSCTTTFGHPFAVSFSAIISAARFVLP